MTANQNLVIALLLISFSGFSQALQVGDINVSDAGIISTTCLIDQKSSDRERYTLLITTSLDNFKKPISFALQQLEPGKPFQISFDGPETLGEYTGDLLLKFRITATTFPVQIENKANLKYKRGKAFGITWTDYLESGWYDVELFQGDQLLQTFVKSFRGKSYRGEISKDIKKGKDYFFRVVPTNFRDGVSDPLPMQVVNKVGWGVKILPIVLIGAGIPVYLSTRPEDPGTTTFDNPPGTPDGN